MFLENPMLVTPISNDESNAVFTVCATAADCPAEYRHKKGVDQPCHEEGCDVVIIGPPPGHGTMALDGSGKPMLFICPSCCDKRTAAKQAEVEAKGEELTMDYALSPEFARMNRDQLARAAVGSIVDQMIAAFVENKKSEALVEEAMATPGIPAALDKLLSDTMDMKPDPDTEAAEGFRIGCMAMVSALLTAFRVEKKHGRLKDQTPQAMIDLGHIVQEVEKHLHGYIGAKPE